MAICFKGAIIWSTLYNTKEVILSIFAPQNSNCIKCCLYEISFLRIAKFVVHLYDVSNVFCIQFYTKI